MSDSSVARARKKFEESMAKSYGEGVVEIAEKREGYTIVPTCSLLLDRALIVGGWVEGRMYELWGAEDGGKTTLALLNIAQAQRMYPNKLTAFIDMEGRLDKSWAKKLGVDLSRMYHIIPKSAEEVADQMKDSIRSGIMSMIVLDSIGAMIAKAEFEKDAGDATVGLVPKIVTRMVNIAGVEGPNYGVTILIINQVREKIGQMRGDPSTTPGGRALKHATTAKIRVNRTFDSGITASVDGVKREVAHGISALVQRNKVGPDRRVAEILLFTEAHPDFDNFVGIDTASEAVSLGVDLGLINQSGAWYSLAADPDFRAQGKQGMASMLRSRPDLIAKVRQAFIDAQASLVIEDTPFDPDDIPDDLSDDGTSEVPTKVKATK